MAGPLAPPGDLLNYERKVFCMKKLLALLLSAILLLSACAFAEEAADVTHSHRLSDVVLLSGEQAFDFSSIAVELDVSGAEKPDAVCLHLDVDGETVVELGVALVDGLYVCHLESESLGHEDFVIDPVVFLAQTMDRGIDFITAMLESVDTTAAAQAILDSINGAGKAPAEAAPSAPAPEQSAQPLPNISFEGDFLATIQECVSEPETVQMGGVDYLPSGREIVTADGTYQSTEFTIDTETVCKILNMIYVNGEPSGWGDKLREAGIDYRMHGNFLTGEEEGLNEIGSLDATFDVDDTHLSVNVNVNTGYTEEGKLTEFTYGVGMGEQTGGLSLVYADAVHEGARFTADSIDMESATVLTDMEQEEALKLLGDALAKVGTDAVSALTAPIMSALLSSADLGELQAENETVPAE